MHQSTFAEGSHCCNQPVASRRLSDRHASEMGPGRSRNLPLQLYAAVTAAYCATIERLGLGVSDVPSCEVLDEAGNLVARMAYNGRIAVPPV